MTQNNNATIITFPKEKIVRTTNEFTEKLKEGSKKAQIDELVGTLVDNLHENLVYNGVPEGAKFQDDFSLVYEAVAACIYRSFGLPHDLHSMVDDAVEFVDADPIITIDIGNSTKSTRKKKNKESANT